MQATIEDIRARAAQKRMEAHYTATGCAYEVGSIFAGVTLADPLDNSPSWVTQNFNRLLSSEDWKNARLTFAGALMIGDTIAEARRYTVDRHAL